MTGELEYAIDLFDDTTARRMAAHFRSLVENIVADPEASVSELSLMSAAERHEVLVEWNATKVEALAAGSVLQWFETQAETRADALAIASGERHLSYGELNRRARRLSRRLLDAGIHLEGKAGIALPPSPEMVIAVLATFKAGGAYVPLDPESPEERLSFAVRDARLRTLVAERPFVEKLSVYGKPVVTFDGLGVDDGCIVPDRTVDPENLAYVIYTSGSTGRPKGVEVRQAGLSNLVLWHRAEYDVSPRDRATQVADPVFDASVWEVWPYLTAGASLHIAPETVRSSPSHLMEWLAAEAITLSFLSTPLAESVLEESWPRALALRAVLTGGDKLHRGPRRVLPFRLVNHYGPTENTVVTSSGAVPSYHESALPPSIGRPLSRVSVYLSSRELTPSPIGIPGELLVGGASLARGYLDRPALTAEKFIPDFFGEPGQRLYRTGDLARWLADGNIEFLGRIDHQVKVRGHRIELGEIESALREHVRVHEAAVTSFERAPGDTSLAAYVVLDEPGEGDDGSESAGIAEIRRFLGGKIPDYMIPARFTVMDRLPRTPSGKVDRKLLPVPVRTRARVDNAFVAPGTAVEARLAELWSEVLGVERVGVTDNFFELGGHSLLATQLVSRVRGAFEVELPLSELFRAPTIASLAEAIALRTRSSGAGSIPRAPRDQPLPLSFAQQRLWFIDQLVPGNPFYIVAGAVRLTGSLQIGLLRRTLQEIV
ncbi:MAG TPA: amino acid adenylation domain-containing protein, partial [Vicinamibacteria bacterium]